MPRYRFCIGADFGVSTSGVSYYLLGPGEVSNQPPRSIQLQLASEELQPSTLAIRKDDDDNNDDDDDGRLSKWGTGIEEGTPAWELFKLSLVHIHDLTRSGCNERPDSIKFVRQIMDEMTDKGKGGDDIVAEYLKCLWADAKRVLDEQARTRRIAAEDVDFCFMFGSPAVWVEETITQMTRAIEESKMTHVDGEVASWKFIDEPEAAALALVPDMVKEHKLKEGQTIVVADLGGGTVDFISYKISKLTPVLNVQECVAGEGRLLGDLFMRRALYSLVEEEAQREAQRAHGTTILENDKEKIEAQAEELWKLTQLMTAAAWDDMTHEFKVDLSDGTLLSVNLTGGKIVTELREITKGIVELTKKQTSAVKEKTGKEPAMILVVGGFGCNTFLQSEMMRQLDGLGPHIEFADQKGRFAVKNGAAIACVTTFGGGIGMPRTPPMYIKSFVSPKSYGVWDGTTPQNEIGFFVSKGGELPATVVLRPRAFREEQDECRLTIYAISTPLTAVVALKTIKVGIKRFTIICKKPEILERGAQLKLEVGKKGEKGKTVGFKIFVDGEEDKEEKYFHVQNW